MIYILLTTVILGNISFFAFGIRLNVKHKVKFEQLGLDGGLFCYSIKQFAQVIEFVIKKKHIELKDTFLTITGYLFVVFYVLCFLILVLGYFLNK